MAKVTVEAEPQAKQTETKQQPKVREAAGTYVETLRDAAQSLGDSAVAMQDRNVKFVQGVIEQGFAQVEDQTAQLHELYNTLAGQSAERRVALRSLVRESASAYFNLLGAPVAALRRSVATAREAAEKATTPEA